MALPLALSFRVIVAAPGVSPEHLEVSVIDDALRVAGETKKGTEVFCVDRYVDPPCGADIETAKATHDNGVVTIVMQRKAGKRIPIAQKRSETNESKTSLMEGEPSSKKMQAGAASETRAPPPSPEDPPMETDSDEWLLEW